MDHPSRPRWPQLLVVGAGLAVLTFVAYWPVRHNGFVRLDDLDYIARNPVVLHGLRLDGVRWAFTTFTSANWHPLTWISHMIDCDLFRVDSGGLTSDAGQWPGGHHLVNVGIHAANAILVLLLLLRMTGAPWRSALVAALFALHPTHVESVAWASERKDVLSAFFGLLAMMAYVGWTRSPGAARYALIVVAYALSLLAKPMLVTLPGILLLLDYWPLRRIGDRHRPETEARSIVRLVIEKVPLLLMALGSSIVTLIAQQRGGAIISQSHLNFATRLANAAVACVMYLRKTVWPTDLAALYPHPNTWPTGMVLASSAALLAISISVLAVRRTQRELLVGWCWFLGTLLPVIGLVQVGGQSMADRYLYLPSIGLFIMFAWSLAALTGSPTSRGIVTAFSVAAVAACAVLTHAQVQVWRDSITLFNDTLSKTADNVYIEFLLGLELQEQRRTSEALPHLQRYFDFAPDNAPLLVRYAEAMGACGQFRKAFVLYRRGFALDPNFPPQSLSNFACVLATSPDASMRDGALAVRLASKACELTAWSDPRCMFNLAAAQAETGAFDDAIDTAQRASTMAKAGNQLPLAAAIDQATEMFRKNEPLRTLPLESP